MPRLADVRERVHVPLFDERDMPRFDGARERIGFEHVFDVVNRPNVAKLGRGGDWQYVERFFIDPDRYAPPIASDLALRITSFRLDCIVAADIDEIDGREFIDEDREPGWQNLLADLRLHIISGARCDGPYTIVSGTGPETHMPPSEENSPLMWYGHVRPEHELQISPRQQWGVRIEYGYERPPVPVEFMRVVAIGLTTRDIQ